MAETTGIEWTDKTFNPWTGCVKVSRGCKFCYAERETKRHGLSVWFFKQWGNWIPVERDAPEGVRVYDGDSLSSAAVMKYVGAKVHGFLRGSVEYHEFPATALPLDWVKKP